MSVKGRNACDQATVRKALSRFARTWTSLTRLESHESDVYAWEEAGRTSILKLTRQERRTREQLLGELDFIHYLAGYGIQVAKPIPSLCGRYIENIGSEEEDEEASTVGDYATAPYWAYAFEWAEGAAVRLNDCEPELFRQWGALMGQLHSLAELYTPGNPSWSRPRWEESELPAVDGGTFETHPELRSAVEMWLAKFSLIPERSGEFGLIHNDLHHRNFYKSAEGLVLFDFDGLTHHHYASDIAVAIYYCMMDRNRIGGRQSSYELFLHDFLEGYARYRTVTVELQRHIPDWMMLRHIQLYDLSVRLWGEKPSGLPERWMLTRYRKDIVDGTLFGYHLP